MLSKIFSFSKSIFGKLLLSYLSIILISIFIISSLSLSASERIIMEYLSFSNKNSLAQINNNLSSIFDQTVNIITTISLDYNFEKYLTNIPEDSLYEVISKREIENKLNYITAPYNRVKSNILLFG